MSSQGAPPHGIQPEHGRNASHQEEQAHSALAQNGLMALPEAERGHNLGTEGVDGVHGHHLAQDEHPEEDHALEVLAMQKRRQRRLVRRLYGRKLHIGAEHAIHHGPRLGMAPLARQPQGGLGNIVPSYEENHAGHHGAAEHPFPAVFHAVEPVAHHGGHGGAQIPCRRHHSHGDRPMLLGRELGDERGGDGIVGARRTRR